MNAFRCTHLFIIISLFARNPQISFSSADISYTTTSFYPELPTSSITAMSSDNNVSSKRKREDTDQGTAVVAKHLAQTNGTIHSVAKVQL